MVKKVIIAIAIAIVLIIIGTVCLTVYFVSWNNTEKAGNEQVIQSKLNTPTKKALIVYQPTKSDMAEKMVNQIAKGLNDEGYEVTVNYPGKSLSPDVSKYSVVAFGSPTYMFSTSEVISKYISRVDSYSPDAKVVLFATGSDTDIKVLDTMEKNLKGVKAFKKIKFSKKQKAENETIAYNLGKELAK